MQLLEFGVMREKEMIDYLGRIESLEKDIPALLREGYARVESIEECIRSNSFHGMSYDGVPGSGEKKSDSAYFTLRAVYHELGKQTDELAAEIVQINTWQKKLQYVELCIKMMPYDLADIIRSQYVKREKPEEYARKRGYSRATVFNKRKKALAKLLELYNSRFTTSESRNADAS